METKFREFYGELSELMSEKYAGELKRVLKSRPNNFICTNSDLLGNRGSTIYGYKFDDNDDVCELEVIGIKLVNDDIFVLAEIDPQNNYLCENEILSKFDDLSNPDIYHLFCSDLMGWYTMINIIDNVDDYLDE